jgi:hypothetical protein
MLERGVYIHAYTKAGPPGHAGFSTAHSSEQFDEVLSAADEVAGKMGSSRSGGK